MTQLLNIIKAQRYPKATEHISDIQNMIVKLIEQENAYYEQGSVYFRVNSFESYGKLAQMDFTKILGGAGGSGPNEVRGVGDKESSRDFALWKSRGDQDPCDCVWQSTFGEGRPGTKPCTSSQRWIGPMTSRHVSCCLTQVGT